MAQETKRQQGQQIDQYLEGADFPCKKNELERVAQKNDAPRQVLDQIRQLPDRRFESIREVRDATANVQPSTR